VAHLLHTTGNLVSIVVGLLVFFSADAIVVSMEKKMQLSETAKTDMRWRNARLIFRVVGCVAVATGVWQLLR
jgi:hypothetical protein